MYSVLGSTPHLPVHHHVYLFELMVDNCLPLVLGLKEQAVHTGAQHGKVWESLSGTGRQGPPSYMTYCSIDMPCM